VSFDINDSTPGSSMLPQIAFSLSNIASAEGKVAPAVALHQNRNWPRIAAGRITQTGSTSRALYPPPNIGVTTLRVRFISCRSDGFFHSGGLGKFRGMVFFS
jgi:hypothetical protein